jgi:hypothetical protein
VRTSGGQGDYKGRPVNVGRDDIIPAKLSPALSADTERMRLFPQTQSECRLNLYAWRCGRAGRERPGEAPHDCSALRLAVVSMLDILRSAAPRSADPVER